MQAIPGETLEYTLPSRKEAMQLQRTIRGHLEHFWKHAIAPVTFSDLTLVVTMPGAFHDRHGSLLVATRPKTKEFEYRVAVLLAHHAGRIRPCQECQRIFLAARRDQLFCDPRCQMRVASRKWRKTQKKTFEKGAPLMARKGGKDRGITHERIAKAGGSVSMRMAVNSGSSAIRSPRQRRSMAD